MKIQGHTYINNLETMKNNINRKENTSHNFVLEDDITISDSAKKLAMEARDKVSEFRAMRFSSIHGEIKEIPARHNYIIDAVYYLDGDELENGKKYEMR